MSRHAHAAAMNALVESVNERCGQEQGLDVRVVSFIDGHLRITASVSGTQAEVVQLEFLHVCYLSGPVRWRSSPGSAPLLTVLGDDAVDAIIRLHDADLLRYVFALSRDGDADVIVAANDLRGN